jgi:hypothetical protein
MAALGTNLKLATLPWQLTWLGVGLTSPRGRAREDQARDPSPAGWRMGPRKNKADCCKMHPYASSERGRADGEGGIP